MPEERLTKDQRRDYARELARIERERRLKAEARNRVLIRVGATVGIVGVLAAVAGGIWLATRPAGPGPANMLSDGILFTGSEGTVTAVETAGIAEGDQPIATDPTEYDVPLKIVTYLDFGCPFCQQFELTNSAQIQELVAAGQATLEVHPIAILDNSFLSPYPTRAANAAACVAVHEPDSFPAVSDALFQNQPAEGTEGLSNAELNDLLVTAGVTAPEVSGCVSDGRYSDWVELATERATTGPLPNTDVVNVTGTPTILVNGQQYSGSLTDPSVFALFLQTVLATDSGTDGSTPTPTPTPTEEPAG